MKRKTNLRPDKINKTAPEAGLRSKTAPLGLRNNSAPGGRSNSAPGGRLICVCNKVPQAEIERVISRGCQTLPKISTATTAGVGQCGGSCRPVLQKMLDCYLANGNFPSDEVLFPKKTR